MNDCSLDKTGLTSGLDSSYVTTKMVWQTPYLTEIDYSKTNNGLYEGADGSLSSVTPPS